MSSTNVSKMNSVFLIILGTVILLVGLFLLVGGGYLITLGGSWYFAIAGLGLTLSGAFVIQRRLIGAVLYLVVFAASIIWSLWDVGFAFWPLYSRLFALAALAVVVLLAMPHFYGRGRRASVPLAYTGAAIVALSLIVTFYYALQPQPIQTADNAPAPVPGRAVGRV